MEKTYNHADFISNLGEKIKEIQEYCAENNVEVESHDKVGDNVVFKFKKTDEK